MNFTTAKITTAACTLLLFAACNNNKTDNKPEKQGKDTVPTEKTTTQEPVASTDAARGPIINITDTIAPKQTVICVKDSAANFERISGKLAKIYGVTLAETLKKSNLKAAGAPMAWYTSTKAPYFFEAGIPVSKVPAKMGKGVYVKEISTDSAVVAHFYGPYNMLSQGYDAIKEWMKDAKKKSTAAPYEIYIGDPIDSTGKPIDPYKVRTDIVFPRK